MAETLAAPAEGDVLGPLIVQVSADRVRAYAEASGDFNPIHIDPAFAATTAFGAPIAHGMLLLAYSARVLSARFGRAWSASGEMDARFRAPAMVGDTVTVAGSVQRTFVEDERLVVVCKVSCTDSAGQALVTVEARVLLPAV